MSWGAPPASNGIGIRCGTLNRCFEVAHVSSLSLRSLLVYRCWRKRPHRATLTLTCKGTAAIRADFPKPYPLSMDLIVDFTTRTVQGTARQRPYVFDDQLQIAEWNEVTVIFQGFSKFLGKNVSGSMDRMTGDVGMVATSTTETIDYSLKCRQHNDF